ncbi:molybdenum cofactor guanylyltransferase MobA [Zwartia sp.]|uniref:molybdenum cofactor guanylyltransferase MobA n=1 Tax=Zwartia sp. TaxID=2978004 RepID=UPI00271EC3F2|nr:molybdenum cofactor guanylyltransferase MobA [Zwartia sp.]MDO9023693.1 molybdenum cofactor guanylyltransferase MobA [Zwartia sp.]
MEIKHPYDALILAGGRGSRLGGKDKGWVMWQGLPMIEHALTCLTRQTPPPSRILISANRNVDAYQQTGHTVVTDERRDFMGPLAGIEAGLMRCKKNNLLVIPCDTPRLPIELYEQLEQALSENIVAAAAYAVTREGPQPLCCLLKPSAAGPLGKQLDAGHGAVLDWLKSIAAVAVMFEDAESFTNFNSPEAFQAPHNPS